MRGQLLNTVMVLGLVACAAACTRLAPGSQPGLSGSVPAEILDDSLTIPVEWGTLMAVHPAPPNHTRLWFEDEAGTIRLVAYNLRNASFMKTVAVIRRR